MLAGKKRARSGDRVAAGGGGRPEGPPSRKRARPLHGAAAGAGAVPRGGAIRRGRGAPRDKADAEPEADSEDDAGAEAAIGDAADAAGGSGEGGEDNDAAVEGGGLRGFSVAFAKILGREVTGGADPVLAKRHTAAAKLAAAGVKENRSARRRADERLAAKRAHLVDPAAYSAERELGLQRIATKGVVALFNAISKHQKAMEAASAATATAAGGVSSGSEALRAAAAKAGSAAGDAATTPAEHRSFLELLKASAAATKAGKTVVPAAAAVAAPSAPSERATASSSRWAVLEDDYLQAMEEEEAAEGAETRTVVAAAAMASGKTGKAARKAVNVAMTRKQARKPSASVGMDGPDILGSDED